jgi:CDP-6-deoxy-D-xylo-4-hexulose-3-dehydrase
MLLGLDPIMCDCNLEDLSCNLESLEVIFKKENPSALILVSPLGFVPKMQNVVDLCEKYNVLLLEDVCESMGSKYKNKYLGSFGFASFFSMYFGHHLSTIEGGFINTNDEDFYHTLLMMRSHGWDRDLPKWKQKHLRNKYNCTEFEALYNFYLPGFNLRATDLQAFLGLRAVKKLDKYVKRRYSNYVYYNNIIKTNKLKLQKPSNDYMISNFAVPIVHEKRNAIVKELMDNDIEVRPLIAGNMANKPMWKERYSKPSLPNAELLEAQGFYVPNHQDLTIVDIEKITNIINKYE